MKRLESSLTFAESAHRGQWRDGENPLPYFTHPIDVLCKCRYIGRVVDEDMLCAAVLHDILEETTQTEAEIQRLFGDSVANLVIELTRTEPSPRDIQGMTKLEIWELRSELLLAGIEKMSDQAKVIKLADRLSNLEEAQRTRSPKSLARYQVQSKRILRLIPKSVNPRLWSAVKALLT